MLLSYDKPFTDLASTPQYNGNIASVKWQTDSIMGLKAYTYQYDSINRLRNAIYNEYTTAWSANEKYSEKGIFYDQNGNILKLTRNGLLSPNKVSGTIDNLTYYYKGNQLIGVNDAVTGSNYGDFSDNGMTGVPVAATPSTWEFNYDGNGNLTKDINKSIASLQYNRLNLPSVVNFPNNNRIEYSYDATGTKLRKKAYPNGTLSTTIDYVGNFVYENNSLGYILFDEGRIVIPGGTQVEYYMKDHLGNVRVAFTTTGTKVRQVNSYYPFGMNISGLTATYNYLYWSTTKNKYLYNGKEMQDDNLGGYSLNLLDYGARMYDPALGRFHSLDPLAIKYHEITPYNYVANNPIKFIDPDGREILGVTKEDAKKAHDDLNTIFADDKFEKFRGLITQSGKKGDGKKFNKIDGDALSGALDGVEFSEDEQALLDITVNTINSDDKHKIEYVDKGGNISSEGETAFEPNLPSYINSEATKGKYGGLPAFMFVAQGGQGVTTTTTNGTHTLIIEGDKFNNGRAVTTGHELFGHGRSLGLGRTSSQHVDAIRTENLILRAIGKGNVQRDGTNHGPGTKISNPSALPDFR